jgi:hypothetical protein
LVCGRGDIDTEIPDQGRGALTRMLREAGTHFIPVRLPEPATAPPMYPASPWTVTRPARRVEVAHGVFGAAAATGCPAAHASPVGQEIAPWTRIGTR